MSFQSFYSKRSALLCSIVLNFVVIAPEAFSGTRDGGGGGQGVECSADGNAFPLAGLYAYDYAIQSSGTWVVKDNNPLKHLNTVANLFSTKLQRIYPGLGAIMKRFADHFASGAGSWRQFDFQMRDSLDSARGTLPPNCERNRQQITTKIGQDYFTSPERFSRLRESGALQVSVHLVHEMLRLQFSNSNDIAKLTRALHDPAMLNMTSQQWENYLLQEGLFFSQNSLNIHQASSSVAVSPTPRRLISNSLVSQVNSVKETYHDLKNRVSILNSERRILENVQMCQWFVSKKEEVVSIARGFINLRTSIQIVQGRVLDRMSQLSFSSQERIHLMRQQEDLGHMFTSLGEVDSTFLHPDLPYGANTETVLRFFLRHCP